MLLGQVLRFGVQVASVTVLARMISPDDYGLYTMVFAVLGVATVLGDFGLSMAAVQAQDISQGQRSNLFWTNVALGVLLFLIVVIAAPLLSVFYGEPELTKVARAMGFIFLFNSISAQFKAELSARLQFMHLALSDVVSVTIAFIVAVVMAAYGLGYWALVAQQVAIAVLTFLMLVLLSRWMPGLPDRGVPMRHLYRYGANTLGVQLITYATSNVDSILIGRYWGAASLGVYDRAFQIFRLPLQQIAAPLTKVGVPVLSKIQNEKEAFQAYVERGQTILGYGFGGAFLFVAGVAGPIVDIVLGPGWEAAKPILAILALSGVMQSMSYVYSWVFLSRALTGLQLRWSLIGRGAMIVAIGIGVIAGTAGVAVGVVVGNLINWLILTLFPMRQAGVLRLPLFLAGLRPLIALAPLAAILHFVSTALGAVVAPWVSIGIALAISCLYVLIICFVPQIRKDAVMLIGTVRRLKRR